MAVIQFNSIAQNNRQALAAVFDLIAQGKRAGEVDGSALAELLGERYKTRFWWPTPQEQDDWVKKYIASDENTRDTDPALKRPWDFPTWVDALDHIDIDLQSLTIDEQGFGIIGFEQPPNPSGNLETIKELVRLYDGKIIDS